MRKNEGDDRVHHDWRGDPQCRFRHFRFATKDSLLSRDFDLTVAVFAGSKSVIFPAQPYSYRGVPYKEDHIYVKEVGETVRAMVSLHDTFFKTVVCAVSLESDPEDKRPAISFLNQGNGTSVALRLIAEYLDIPTGKRLRVLRKALPRLSDRWMYL